MKPLLSLLGVVLLLTACGPSASTNSGFEDRSNLSTKKEVSSTGYLRIIHRIPEPTVEPTPVVVSFPVTVTHYSCSEQEGTADCITFDGSQAGLGTIASNDWPIGTPMIIEGKHYTVTDRGGGLRPGQVDLWVPDRETAFRLGVKRVTATIVNQTSEDLQNER